MTLLSLRSLAARGRERQHTQGSQSSKEKQSETQEQGTLQDQDGIDTGTPTEVQQSESDKITTNPSPSDASSNEVDESKEDFRYATKARRYWIRISGFCFFISFIFLLLTVVGNIANKAVIRHTWFFNLDLTNIIPASASGDIAFTNSLARSLGLHDFYHIGLWNFCEGYNDEGITHCSKPVSFWWFNPVSIIINELLSGATIALPAEIEKILNLIKLASHIMFGCFLTGTVMSFIGIFLPLIPLEIQSRWWSLPIGVWTFITALLVTIATVIATVMFIIFRNTITQQAELNIGAKLGIQIFGFMWIGCAFAIFGFLVHAGLCCCCHSVRDIKRSRVAREAQEHADTDLENSTGMGARSKSYAIRKRHGKGLVASLPKFGGALRSKGIKEKD